MHPSPLVVAVLVWFVTLLITGCGEETVSAPASVAQATTTPNVTPLDPTASVLNVGPQGDTWITVPSLPGGARQETGVVSVDGELWVLGGFDAAGRIVSRVEIYDPRAGKWRRGPDLPLPMHHANVAALHGTVYVAGFLTRQSFAANGSVFALDPSGGWEPREPMPEGTHRGASGIAVADGKLFLVGGFRGSAVDDFSAYDPATDRWTVLANLPVPADHLVAEAIDGIVFAAGGRGGSIASHRSRLDAYDPMTGRWSARAPMPTSRAGAAAAVRDGRIYVFGGEGNRSDASGVFANTESYDPLEDRWRIHTPMPIPRHGTGAATIGSVIYVPGGADVAGFGAVAATETFTPGTTASAPAN